MVVNVKKRHILGALFFIYFVVYLVWYSLNSRPVPQNTSTIPAPDPGRPVFIYDLNNNRWIYKDQMDNWYQPDDRVYGRPYTEEDAQRYLEKHLRGYKKDTYWGQQYEYPTVKHGTYDAVPHDIFDDNYEIEDPLER